MIYALGERRPDLPPLGDFWIAPDANIIGHVKLHLGASIWFGATLRGDNEWITVGSGSNIQENCVLHTDPGYPLEIGTNCTIGHKAMLHGCTIGDQTLIGMGAIILNGARIGKNCLIGAGALITEGKDIPDGSMVVGAPGRIIRQTDESVIASNISAAAGYRSKFRLFQDQLKEI